MKTSPLSTFFAILMGGLSFAQEIDHNNIIARYSFDKAPTQDLAVRDISKPVAHGTLWIKDPIPVLQFGGVDYVELPQTLRGHDIFSVSAWFLPDAENVPMILLGSRWGYNLEISYEDGAGGKLRWQHYTDRWQPPVFSDAPVVVKKWHQVVVTCDGTTTRLYLDGVPQNITASSKGKILAPGEPEFIGRSAPRSGDRWIGCLRDLSFYGEALSDEKVQALYNSGKKEIAKAVVLSEQRKLTWKTQSGFDYLALVKAYADVMIEKGRDTYGPKSSPLFAAALNRYTFRIGNFPDIEGIRSSDRITTGANPMTDENLYQILYALSVITHDPSYAAEADKALKFFFENAQSPVTGLMAWGEHTGWSFELEKAISPFNFFHEFARPWVLWNQCYRLAPDPCVKFAHGLWDHQISDQVTGNFSRHATWDKHDPGKDFDFPRHGGFYMATWARAYADTKDPVFLKAIETLTDRYQRKASAKSGAIPAESSKRNPIPRMWPLSNLSMAIDLTDAASLLGSSDKALSTKMLDEAAGIDRTFLALKHDEGDKGTFFVSSANVDTLEPLPDADHSAYSHLWEESYGVSPSSNYANVCYRRYLQLPESETKEAYRKLILDCANLYLRSDPNLTSTIYPGVFGGVIWMLVDAYGISGDSAYLKRAEHFAQLAAESFFRGDIPLPTASSVSTHYESITGGDSLMASLLYLWNHQQPRPYDINMINCDR